MAFVNQLSTAGVLKKDRKVFQEQYNQVYYMQYEEYTRHLRKCFVNFFRSLLNPFRREAWDKSTGMCSQLEVNL